MKNLEKKIYNPEVYNQNLADFLDAEDLAGVGKRVIEEYQIDCDSCDDWWKRTKPSIDLAMQVARHKNFPFDGAANVKYPLITVAALQFSARAYPAIVKDKNIVKGKIIGKDVIARVDTGEKIEGGKSAIAQRISQHMSFQLLEEMEEWEEGLDRCLMTLPIVGEDWQKTYYDTGKQRCVSVRVPSENIVYNYYAQGVDVAPRISEKIWLYPNQIIEKQRSGLFRDVELNLKAGGDSETGDKGANANDDDALVLFIEQHRWLDLDDDGYKEPYIVTVHKESETVVRVYPRFEQKDVARNKKGQVQGILPTQYFTQKIFFPSPDGGSRGLGLGALLNPINETINSTINQLLDAGTLYNNNSGFIGRGVRLRRDGGGGVMDFKLGEWKEVPATGDDLRKNIYPLPVKEPSGVMFSMLGLMIESGKEMSSISQVMAGETPGANASPTAIMSLIEQGTKVFSGVYKRVYRSLKSEFKKLYRLNAVYLDDTQYFRVMDDEMAIHRMDYNVEGVDVIPVADPNEISDTQKMARAEALRSLMGAGFNDNEIRRRVIASLDLPEPEKLVLPDEMLNQPDPVIELKMRKQALDEQKFQWQMVVDRVDMQKAIAMASKAYAEADAAIKQPDIDVFKAQLSLMDTEAERIHNERLQRMAGQSADKGVSAKAE